MQRKMMLGWQHSQFFPIALAIQVVSATDGAYAAAPASTPAFIVDIPALPAKAGLKRLVDMTGIQLLYATEVLEGLSTRAVRGRYSSREALQHMLAGSAVQVRESGPNAFTLLREVRSLKRDSETVPEVLSLAPVIVTATKRASEERSVAGSVTVIDGAELDRPKNTGYEDALRQAPGVQYNKGEGGYALLSVRGITTTTAPSTAQGTTGVYIEDVPLTDPYSLISLPDIASIDLERMEVLRGPQGVLFGSASLGGAIRYVLKKPDHDVSEGAVELSGTKTSHGGTNYGLTAMVNRVNDSKDLAIRVLAYDRDSTGYISNTTTGGQHVNSSRKNGARISGSWRPTADLSVIGILMAESSRTDDSDAVSSPDAYYSTKASAQPRRMTTGFANLQVNYDFANVRFSSNTGLVHKRIVGRTDLTGLLADVFPNPPAPLKSSFNNLANSMSQEFRLNSRASEGFDWMGGVFYQRFLEHFEGSIGGVGASSEAQRIYGARIAPALLASLTANDVFFTQSIKPLAQEAAVFFEGSWSIAERWTATVGARSYRTSLRVDGTQEGLLNYLSLGAGMLTAQQQTSDSGMTPKVSIRRKSESGDIWYALASKGYRFGGLNIIPPTQGTGTPTNFKSDSLWNYETGVRLTGFSGRLAVDVTAFYMDWRNAQLNVLRPDAFVYIANIGRASSKGVEAAVRLRATRSLTLSSSAVFIDAKTTADAPSAPKGSRLPGTPRGQLQAQAAYSFAGPFGSNGTARVNYSRSGKYFPDLQQTVELGDYGLLDLSASFELGEYELTAYASNATNVRAPIASFSLTPTSRDWYLTRPMTVGLTFRAWF